MKQVDAYIEGLPEERQKICDALRELIFEIVPGVEEKLSFKIPFYHYYGMFAYLNNTKKGVDLVFCRGKDLVELFPQLQTKNRAIAASVTIIGIQEINRMEMREMITTAANWNKEAKSLGIPMVKKGTHRK